jgi:hypothetical protein
MSCLVNLKAKHDDTKEWVSPMSNKTLTSKEHIESVPEIIVFGVRAFCWVRVKTCACLWLSSAEPLSPTPRPCWLRPPAPQLPWNTKWLMIEFE